jgi:hypothetical protein
MRQGVYSRGAEPDEITPRRAAKILGVHQETIYRWCQDALAGKKSRLTGHVRRSITGRYFISTSAVFRIS